MKTAGSAALLAAAMGLGAASPQGTVERITVHGKALEGNLSGDRADREVAVYLPPGYADAPARRFPVLYLLHGFTDSVERWWGSKPHFVNVPKIMEQALAAGVREMIVVMPDAFTRFHGSMYSSSATIGDWEKFVSRDVVTHIDQRYRTIADRWSSACRYGNRAAGSSVSSGRP